MRIKHAYNTVIKPESRRNYDFGNRTSNYSTSETNRSSTIQEEEEFYGFGITLVLVFFLSLFLFLFFILYVRNPYDCYFLYH